MRGVPRVMNTKQDWVNAYQYALHADSEARQEMRSRLIALKEAKTVLVLKADAPEDPEEHTPDHFEPVNDVKAPFFRVGITESELDQMISSLG